MNSNILTKVMIGIIAIALLFLLGASIIYYVNFSGNLSDQHDRWGTFGDFMGGTLNPLLSFLSLIALLLTIILQNQELVETRNEIKLTREAQEKSEIALSEQSETLIKNLDITKLDNFIRVYDYYASILTHLCASVIRPYLDSTDRLWDNWKSFGDGYTDIFANGIKNQIMKLGKDEFLRVYNDFFQDNGEQLELYCNLYEELLSLSSKSSEEETLRKSIEFTGLGVGYIAICNVLGRETKFILRNPEFVAKKESQNNYGFPDSMKNIKTGIRGGKYYLNSKGRKVYIKTANKQ